MIGQTLAHYRITAAIGAGGMGEVYRATDTKLGREVALKVLPAEMASDPERFARFQREAQLLASLNHPNIAAIYGVEEPEGRPVLVLELVEGEDLAERLKRGPLPVDEAALIAKQIAEALEEAHEKGIVHRDLKPANVKVTSDGRVKVLDFGLAKAYGGEAGVPSAPDLSQSPTLVKTGTRAGVILGTAAYMPPEQARGHPVDKRADVWAFGVVLHEMLTGKRLFAAPTLSDTLAEVLKSEPDWGSLPARLPPSLTRLLRRCLERDPKQRLRDIGEARIALGEALRGDADERPLEPAASAVSRRRALWWAGSLLLAVGVAGWSAWKLKPEAGEPPLRRFELPVAPTLSGVTFRDAFNGPVISPDGTKVAFTRDGRLWVRPLDGDSSTPLPNTEAAEFPFWSPDSQHLAYFKNASVEVGTLWVSSVQGGPSTQVAATPGGAAYGATWTPSGAIVLALAGQSHWSEGRLWTVPAGGGSLAKWTGRGQNDDEGLTFPHVLPDGKSLVAAATTREGVGSLVVLDPSGQTPLVRHPGEVLAFPTYAPSGYIVYQRGLPVSKGIWALPFDAASLRATGEPFVVAADGAFPSVARDGTLLYLRITGESRQELAWVDGDGRLGEAIGQPQEWITVPHLSPGGSRVAVAGEEAGNVDIWIHDVRRPVKSRLTTDPALDFDPTWSPDGTHLAFASSRSGRADIFLIAADGSGEPRPVVTGPYEDWDPSWSRDGRVLSYLAIDPKTGVDSLYIAPTGNSEPKVFLKTPGLDGPAVLSPDGSLAAFGEATSILDVGEVYLARFPSGEGRVQASVNGTTSQPVWSRRGDELYYVQDNTLMAVSVERQPTLRVGAARPLFSGEAIHATLSDPANWRPRFEVAADGKRFVVIRNLSARTYTVSVVQNWAKAYRGTR